MTETIDPVADSRERELNSLYRLTLLVTLIVVTMTFGALIFVFFFRSFSAENWLPIELPGILWATTIILIASSVTFEIARQHLKANQPEKFFRWTAWSTGLGVLFLVGQLIAWFQILRTGVLLVGNPHTSFIFIFSGLHGLHILVGLAGLIYLLVRTREPVSGPKYQMTTRVWANAASVFWHYLGFMWILLYGLLFFWKR